MKKEDYKLLQQSLDNLEKVSDSFKKLAAYLVDNSELTDNIIYDEKDINKVIEKYNDRRSNKVCEVVDHIVELKKILDNHFNIDDINNQVQFIWKIINTSNINDLSKINDLTEATIMILKMVYHNFNLIIETYLEEIKTINYKKLV